MCVNVTHTWYTALPNTPLLLKMCVCACDVLEGIS